MKIMIQKLKHGSVVNGFRIRSGLLFMDIFQRIRVNLKASTPKRMRIDSIEVIDEEFV